jgi:hypothetical protein
VLDGAVAGALAGTEKARRHAPRADEVRKETGRAEQARRTGEDNAAAAERREQHAREAYTGAKATHDKVAAHLSAAQQQNTAQREALQTAATPRAPSWPPNATRTPPPPGRAADAAQDLDDTRRRLTAAEQARDTAAADAAVARTEADRQRARADAAVTDLQVERGRRDAAEA